MGVVLFAEGQQGVAKRAVTHGGREQGVEHGTQLMWRELKDWTEEEGPKKGRSVSQTEYTLAQPMPDSKKNGRV